MTVLINADNIGFQSGDNVILSHVSVKLHESEILTIIGPNGAGKTTLLRILTGLLSPSSGNISYAKKLTFGYMPQNLDLNTALPLPVHIFLHTDKHDPAVLQQTLEELNISHLINQSMHRLSGGEKQRVMLARAMLRRPDVLVLDEPAQGVDIAGQHRFYDLIDQVRQHHHCAVLMVSHDLHLVMAKTDHVICLNRHVCCQGHPENVSSDQAYLSLFGKDTPPSLAIYTHHHNHHHDLHGEVIDGEHREGCEHDH